MIAITAATQLTMMTTRSQRLLFVVNGGNSGHCRQKWRSMAATAMVVFVNSGRH
jgi:hypothetical protein